MARDKIAELRAQTVGRMTCRCGRPMMLLNRAGAMVCLSGRPECGRLTWTVPGVTFRRMAAAWPDRLVEQARVSDFVPLAENVI